MSDAPESYLTRKAIREASDDDLPPSSKKGMLRGHDNLDTLADACGRVATGLVTSPPIHPHLAEIRSLAAELQAIIKSVER